MRQLTIRLDDEVHSELERRARQQRRSLNQVVSEVLHRALGLPNGERAVIGDALDGFACDLSVQEADELLDTTSVFDQIDEDLWS